MTIAVRRPQQASIPLDGAIAAEAREMCALISKAAAHFDRIDRPLGLLFCGFAASIESHLARRSIHHDETLLLPRRIR